jgi:hypothetical protein
MRLSEKQVLYWKVRESTRCPYCHAPSGRPCRNKEGKNTEAPHRKRVTLYEYEHGMVEYLAKIRVTCPEDAKVIDELAKAKCFFYEGPGVIMPSGRRLKGNQMRLLIAAAGYNPLKPPHSFEERGAGLSEVVRD